MARKPASTLSSGSLIAISIETVDYPSVLCSLRVDRSEPRSMFPRILAFVSALILIAAPAEARRIALVVGQNSYPGGAYATIGLPTLHNPVRDALRMAELLTKHGFDVISCDGKTPGCHDL